MEFCDNLELLFYISPMSLWIQGVSPKADSESRIGVQGHEGVRKWGRKGGQLGNICSWVGYCLATRTRTHWDSAPLRDNSFDNASCVLVLGQSVSLMFRPVTLRLEKALSKRLKEARTQRLLGKDFQLIFRENSVHKSKALIVPILSVWLHYIPSNWYSASYLEDA